MLEHESLSDSPGGNASAASVLISGARTYGDWKQNCSGQDFWARGYLVSITGRNEATHSRVYSREEWKSRCYLKMR